ncbi:MAG TPA: SPOR domain-containing protein [Bacteroidales bacterium]|nr:SPOR domain-containing protein [Bacteroidales bacterium]HPT20420.1 SPOR domain-containing protein [Bacteroidales bacterium]
MDITAFIRELLFSHDCVIVPGFGGLLGNYTPAHIDKSTGTFFPPVKQISFNRNLNHNDGLLVGRISGSAGITYGDARNLVEDFVAEIRRKLERGEKVVFDNIGNFINNQEGNVQFEPDRIANYHLDSYGLESFQCLPLEGYDVRKQVMRHIDKEPVKQYSMRKVLWRAAVIIPLLAVIVAIPLKTDLFKGRIETTTMNPLVTAEFENNKKAVEEGEGIKNNDLPVNVMEVTTSESETPVVSADIAPAIVPNAVPAASVTPVEKGTYCLITGSFKSEENAMIQVNMLKEEGFSPEIISVTNGFYRVRAMVCSDLNTAKAKKDSISGKFPGAWISKID